ncbi:hypothetical protein J6590_013946 [Homalodisca vitripennis]|nr:hypothetical protein J6590_013946 [Homalodisca vitripennis]
MKRIDGPESFRFHSLGGLLCQQRISPKMSAAHSVGIMCNWSLFKSASFQDYLFTRKIQHLNIQRVGCHVSKIGACTTECMHSESLVVLLGYDLINRLPLHSDDGTNIIFSYEYIVRIHAAAIPDSQLRRVLAWNLDTTTRILRYSLAN